MTENNSLPLVLPSLLSADFAHLARSVNSLEKQGVKLFHLDIMDGHFVPNLTVGPGVIKKLLPYCQAEFDVHLMVTEPRKITDWFLLERCTTIMFHIEVETNPTELINYIHKQKRKAGLVVNPPTPLVTIEPFLKEIDQVLIMSVNPGFAGQKYINKATDKIADLYQMRKKQGLKFLIEVDGGLNLETIKIASKAGADLIVAGHAIFDKQKPALAFKQLQKQAKLYYKNKI